MARQSAGDCGHRRNCPGRQSVDPVEIFRQARVAFEKAALLVLVVDNQAGITPLDQELARMLRTTGKPFVIAVNKVDAVGQEAQAAEFHKFGVTVFPIAAEHGTGMDDLLDYALKITEAKDTPPEKEIADEVTEIAIIGRPNVGKSTLLNRMAGEERSIVSPIPGTTMDTVDTEVDPRRQAPIASWTPREFAARARPIWWRKS